METEEKLFQASVDQLTGRALDPEVLVLLPLLGVTTDSPVGRRGFFGRAGLKIAVAAGTALGLSSYTAARVQYEKFRHQLVPPTVYDAATIFNETNTPPSVNPPTRPTIEPHPTPVEVVGNRHLVEFLFGNLIDQLITKRQERYKKDPAFRERVTFESLSSPTLSTLLLITDETRDKPNEFAGGGGRADVVMIINFDPKNLKTIALSFPRDLFVPELAYLNISDGGAKINNLTIAPAIDPSLDPYELARQVMESATKKPLDVIVQANIDFIKGFIGDNGSFQPGVFDRLFPNGLEIEVPKILSDPFFPSPNYGTERVTVEKGTQVVDGETVARFTRTRVDSDYARDDRQRQVVSKAVQNILTRGMQDLVREETTTLDALTSSLEEQAKASNLFFDLNIIAVAKTIRNKFRELRSTAEGLGALSALTVNTKRVMGRSPEDSFISLGITPENKLVENVTQGERYYRPYTVRVRGSRTLTPATEQGNFLEYWGPIRQLTQELLGN